MEVDAEPGEINGVFLAFWAIIFIFAGVVFYFVERSFARHWQQHYPEFYKNLASTKQAVPHFWKRTLTAVVKLYRVAVSSYRNSTIASHIMQNIIPAILFMLLVSYLLLFASKWLLNLSYQ